MSDQLRVLKPLPPEFAQQARTIGEPLTFVSWFPVCIIQCTCKPPTERATLVLKDQVIQVCPHCKKGYRFRGVNYHVQAKPKADFDIEVILFVPDKDGEETKK